MTDEKETRRSGCGSRTGRKTKEELDADFPGQWVYRRDQARSRHWFCWRGHAAGFNSRRRKPEALTVCSSISALPSPGSMGNYSAEPHSCPQQPARAPGEALSTRSQAALDNGNVRITMMRLEMLGCRRSWSVGNGSIRKVPQNREAVQGLRPDARTKNRRRTKIVPVPLLPEAASAYVAEGQFLCGQRSSAAVTRLQWVLRVLQLGMKGVLAVLSEGQAASCEQPRRF